MSVTDHPAPLIGIPVRLSDGDAPDADVRIGEANRIFDEVVGLVRAAGAEPVLLQPDSADSPLDERLADCAGFVVPGGGDVDPALYGADSDHPSLYDVNPVQDGLDAAVVRYALEHRRPMLGICRGMQLLNILRGGSLHVDMAPTPVTHNPEPGVEWAVHDVALSADSAVAEAFGRGRIPVASGHHQAVDRVGDGLRVSARADDGCVEAVEASGDPRAAWTVGVQWHPEALEPDSELRLPLFRALLAQVNAQTDGPADAPAGAQPRVEPQS
ncbi:gamma-glutamyl-gamma-aminobutyrate hydrolase family protein [Kitasatospora sp. NPDC048286]|uniref:gamma-glutamyl-gamma-aminobutyrate hydrolase family protein n=1 Tax=Kitasatospora sp. NPDC048286 TaxID=3364047 RepID=UPI003722EEB3